MGGQGAEVQTHCLEKKYEVDLDDHSSEYACIFLPEHSVKTSIEMKGLPNIKATNNSEHATEGEIVMLGCKLDS